MTADARKKLYIHHIHEGRKTVGLLHIPKFCTQATRRCSSCGWLPTSLHRHVNIREAVIPHFAQGLIAAPLRILQVVVYRELFPLRICRDEGFFERVVMSPEGRVVLTLVSRMLAREWR